MFHVKHYVDNFMCFMFLINYFNFYTNNSYYYNDLLLYFKIFIVYTMFHVKHCVENYYIFNIKTRFLYFSLCALFKIYFIPNVSRETYMMISLILFI